MSSVLQACLVSAAIGLQALSAWSQSVTSSGDGSHIIPFSEALRAKGIPITPAGLALALRNSDPSVRTSAAAFLAQSHASDAQSLIESAMASERNPTAEVEMASILMGLGDPAGTDRLADLCKSSSEAAATITYAAGQLVLRGSGSQCVDEPLRRLQSPNSPPSEVPTLLASVGPLYQVASIGQQSKIILLLKQHMTDQDQTTRLVVSRALAQTGSPISRNILEAALIKEKDSIVRATIKSDLTILPAGKD